MKFRCPQCGQRLECETLHTGWSARCPRCARRLVSSEVMTSPSESGLTASDDDSPNAILLASGTGGKYQRGELVAQGGTGTILTAKDLNIRRYVAMKVLRDPKAATREQVLRFIEEAQITGQLEHPGVVSIHKLGVDEEGHVFYTMKLVRGTTLRDILDRIRDGDPAAIRDYPLSRLVNIFQRVCDTVAFAHSRHVIHRDLKPENIMVGDYGEVQVMDWGLAKVLTGRRSHATPEQAPRAGPSPKRGDSPTATLSKVETSAVESVRGRGSTLHTVSGEIMGTPGFMAPEQAAGDSDLTDERSDIYSLGAILYNILTLRPPIQGDTVEDILHATRSGRIVPPSDTPLSASCRENASRGEPDTTPLAHCPGGVVPRALSAVAMKALAVHPCHRYPTVRALQRDIEAYQNGFLTSAEEASLWRMAVLFVRRHRAAAVATLISLVVLAAALAASYYVNLQERLKAEAALRKYQEAEAGRRTDRRHAAPALVETARALIEKGSFSDARATLLTAIEFDPELPDARLLLALVEAQGGNLRSAAQQIAEYLRARPEDSDAQQLHRICYLAVKRGVKNAAMGVHSHLCHRLGVPTLGAAFIKEAADQIPLLRAKVEKAWPVALRKLTLTPQGELSLTLGGSSVVDVSRLCGMPLNRLTLRQCPVRDLTPLKDLPLRALALFDCRELKDLSPLHGMGLHELYIERCPHITHPSFLRGLSLRLLAWKGDRSSRPHLVDLHFLRHMKLMSLDVAGCRISDLSPLTNMPLTSLQVPYTQVTDLSPVRTLPLQTLNVSYTPIRSLEPLRGLSLRSLSAMGCPQLPDYSPLYGMKTLIETALEIPPILRPVSRALQEGDIEAAVQAADAIATGFEAVPSLVHVSRLCRVFIEETAPLLRSRDRHADSPLAARRGGHQYLLCRLPLSRAEAQRVCEVFSARLAVIPDSGTQHWLTDTFVPHASDGLLIGAFSKKGSNQWQWPNGEPCVYTNWASGQPNIPPGSDRAVILGRNGTWDDVPVTRCGPFLMEWESPPLSAPAPQEQEPDT